MSLFGGRGSLTIDVALLKPLGVSRVGPARLSGRLVRGDQVSDSQGRVGLFVGTEPEGRAVIWWSFGRARSEGYAEAVAEFDRAHNPWPLVQK